MRETAETAVGQRTQHDNTDTGQIRSTCLLWTPQREIRGRFHVMDKLRTPTLIRNQMYKSVNMKKLDTTKVTTAQNVYEKITGL